MKKYDVIIIGAGPAGLSAGLYSARAKMSTLIIEKERPGGQIVTTHEVANYPGSIEEATGPSLVARMVEQAEEFGAKRVTEEVLSLDLTGDIKKVKTESEVYESKAVILASGAHPRKLGVEGEDKFVGRGLSYCATCDADFFSGLPVLVIGGGDTAVEEALFLTKFASEVTIVHRRDELRAAKSIIEKANKNPKIKYIWDTVVERINGNVMMESVELKNIKTGEVSLYQPEGGMFGVFVFVGYLPNTDFLSKDIDLDDRGYIIAGENMKTNIAGVFAAGDVRVKSLRQVVTATADGAIAAVESEKYIELN